MTELTPIAWELFDKIYSFVSKTLCDRCKENDSSDDIIKAETMTLNKYALALN